VARSRRAGDDTKYQGLAFS